MEKLTFANLSRSVVGSVLMLAALFSLLGAAAFQAAGLVSHSLGPIPYVGAVVFLKLGLFAFWPRIKAKNFENSGSAGGKKTATALRLWLPLDFGELRQPVRPKPKSMALWDQNDPRLDSALFAANVPTFVLNHEQRFLDWNPAFELVFGACADVKRGAHVSLWFDHLDNFRRVSKRAEKLYGEGILPIADRERATFISPEFGRMVFTKLMTPIVDRSTGRVIGWNVVLNINSVNKRHEFFDRLYADIAAETRRIRYAAAFDGIFKHYTGLKELVRTHVQAVEGAERVLDLGAGTGILTRTLAKRGHRITAVDGNVHLLRRLRDKCAVFGRQVKIVKQDPDLLRPLPEAKFDAAVLMNVLQRLDDPLACLQAVHRSLKPGAVISLSVVLPSGNLDDLFNSVRTELEAKNYYENLQHQFNQVLEYEREEAAKGPARCLARETVRALLLEAGFSIDSEIDGLLDGHTLLLRGRRL